MRIDRLARGEGVTLRQDPRRAAQRADQPTELALDDELGQVLVAEGLRHRPAGVGGCREVDQDVVVEEVGERAMADVVEQARDAQGLDDQPLGRRRTSGFCVGQRRPQGGIQLAGPQARLVHHAEPVGEPAVLCGREDPPGALELADPAQPLEPGRVQQVLFGDALVGQPDRRGGIRLEPLGELDVPVDRVADEVDRRERDGGASSAGYGTHARRSRDQADTFPRLSRAWTRTVYQWPRARWSRLGEALVVPVRPPRTSTPPTAPRSHSTTLHPVRAS